MAIEKLKLQIKKGKRGLGEHGEKYAQSLQQTNAKNILVLFWLTGRTEDLKYIKKRGK